MNTNPKILLNTVLIATMLFFVNCNSSNRSSYSTEDNMAENEKVEEEWKDERENLKNELKEIGDDIDYKINEIEENMEDVSEDVQTEWEKTLEDLRNKKADVNKKLDKVEKSAEKDWEEVKADVENGLEQMDNELDKIGEDIKDAFSS